MNHAVSSVGQAPLRPSLNAVAQSDAAATPARVGPMAAELARRRRARALARPLWIVAICVLVAALRLGRDLLVPVVLAVLLALVLSGIVETLRRWRIPRAVSAVVLVLLIGTLVGSVLHAVGAPARQWMESAPRVLRTIEHKTRAAQSVVRRLDALVRRASAIAGAGDAPAAA